MDEPSKARKKSRSQSVYDWIGTPSFYIYVNYVLGAWGDRMWHFAVGLFLVKLSGGVLRLAAIYGFCGGGCVLLFGGFIGQWVDSNRRLKVIVTTLFLQNFSVMLSALAVLFTLRYTDWIDETWGGNMRYICEGAIVTLAICAQLASVGYKIAIEKDWIVVVAAKNKALLAKLNAVTRAIDLSCKLLAPCTVGLVMTYLSDELAAIFIAVWNFVSVFVEFGLLRKVYSLVPALAVKGTDSHPEVFDEDPDEQDRRVSLNPAGDDGVEEATDAYVRQESSVPLKGEKTESKKSKEKKSCVQIMFDPFIMLVRGWRTYARQKVVYAGLSLSFLYMTVLGFDSITTGYIYANGVKEYLVAVSMGLAGFTGIIGTICFTYCRKKRGLERTGLIAFSVEILFLCLCVASVFAPGSPFEPLYNPYTAQPRCASGGVRNETDSSLNVSGVHDIRRRAAADFISGDNDWLSNHDNGMQRENMALIGVAPLSHGDLLSLYSPNHDFHLLTSRDEVSGDFAFSIDGRDFKLQTSIAHSIVKRQASNFTNEGGYEILSDDKGSGERRTREHDPFTGCQDDEERTWVSYISILLFLIGIITSRIGLWMADLVVTQLLQENVVEGERGVVNGVQNSLNMLMDMLKFTLVIGVPHIQHFGYLVLASFLFICIGGSCFAYHSWRVRGHLFHFEKICGSARHSNGHVVEKGLKQVPAEEGDQPGVGDMV